MVTDMGWHRSICHVHADGYVKSAEIGKRMSVTGLVTQALHYSSVFMEKDEQKSARPSS